MKFSKKMLNRLLMLAALGFVASSGLTLTACNTVEGVGKDVEAAGDAVADTARDAKE